MYCAALTNNILVAKAIIYSFIVTVDQLLPYCTFVSAELQSLEEYA